MPAFDENLTKSQRGAPLGPRMQSLLEPAFLGLERRLERIDDILKDNPEKPESAFLVGNFAPVDEEQTLKNLRVDGEIPKEVRGVFMRNGPNPKYAPPSGYHLFDGDGMVHGVEFTDEGVSYANRWVQTNKLDHEDNLGLPLFVNIGDMKGGLGLTRIMLQMLRSRIGLIDLDEGIGRANTSFVGHAGQIWALHEADTPYALKRKPGGVFETIGRVTFDGALDIPMTAHPKVDPKTGEMFFYGCDLRQKPYCGVGVVDKDGQLVRSFQLPLPVPTLIHDCALTENYFVVVVPPIFFRPQDMLATGQLPMSFDPTEPLRIGLLPRNAKSGDEVRWFHLPNGAVFHTLNAWEEEGELHIYAFRSQRFDLDILTAGGPVVFPPECRANLYQLSLDLKTGNTRQVRIGPPGMFLDFPCIHPDLEGSKLRYAYAVCFDEAHSFKAKSIVKLDLQRPPGDVVVERYEFGQSCYGGDCAFVPKKGKSTGAGAAGYLITLVRDERRAASYVEILDAAELQKGPLARVSIPCRVPYGFHCYFLSDGPVTKKPSKKEPKSKRTSS